MSAARRMARRSSAATPPYACFADTETIVTDASNIT